MFVQTLVLKTDPKTIRERGEVYESLRRAHAEKQARQRQARQRVLDEEAERARLGL